MISFNWPFSSISPGGIENPFAFLFLVPVTVSATSLPLKWTLWLSRIAFVCASYLAIDPSAAAMVCRRPLTLPEIYVAGMWTAIVSGVVFSSIYARRIAEEARQMSAALTADGNGAGPRAAAFGP